MKIKQLKEKTIKGFIDFLPKIVVDNIEGLSNILNDKLSKSEGGEINKPIVITNKDSNYSITINPDGSIYIWSKDLRKNIFKLLYDESIDSIAIGTVAGKPVKLNAIKGMQDATGNIIYYNNVDGKPGIFYSRKYVIIGGTNEQVLLGDGTTTGKLVKDIKVNQDNVDKKNTLLLMLQYIDGTALGTELPKATIESAGLMTATDKAKLDDIERTYVSTQNGNIYSSYDTNNGNTTLNVTGNYDEEGSGGKIRLKRTEDGKGKLSIMIDGQESSVNAEKFNSIISPNKNEVWSTDGSRINVLNLLSNAAIYVEGDTVKINSALLISTETITDPDYIMFEENTGMFIALKNNNYFKNWNISKKRTIGNPIRYGTIIKTSVYPFHNQMYRFRNNTIMIANCSGDKPVFNKLTL